MDIKQLIRSTDKHLTANFDFKGVILKVRFVSKSKSQQLARAATVHSYKGDKGVRSPEMQLDRFNNAFLKEAVEGWENVTPRKLQNIVPINDLTEEQLDTEIPFSHEALKTIIDEAYELDKELSDFCTDITNFKPNQVEELGNSATSQSGN